MKSSILLVVLFLSSFGHLFAQDVKVYPTFSDFESLLQLEDDKVHVINFWATWCKPCVKELPYFEELSNTTSEEEVEVILVTLDFSKDLEKRVIPFLEKQGYTAKVVLLDDGKPNQWIDKVDPSWSGAIPATLFYKGDKKVFKEQEFHSTDELRNLIKENF